MESFEEAVATIEKSGPGGRQDRDAALDHINRLVKAFKDGIAVWEDYLKSPGEKGDKWTQVSWIGPERAKRLHEISLDAREAIHQFCILAGAPAQRFDLLEENPVVQAYRMLRPDETGPDAARSAIELMQKRLAAVETLAQRVRAARQVSQSATPKASKSDKPAAGKSRRKKGAVGRKAASKVKKKTKSRKPSRKKPKKKK